MRTSIYLIAFLLCGCGMLKKTTKEQQLYKQESSKVTEMNQLDLNKIYRETERYSFHPDGTIAAHEFEREEVVAASLSKLKQQEHFKEESKAMKKTSSPARLVMLAGLLVLVFSGYVFVRKWRLYRSYTLIFLSLM